MGNGESETTESTGDGFAEIVCFACGQRHSNAMWKVLPDGRRVGLHSMAAMDRGKMGDDPS
jgi:hypothetical protein